MVIALLIIICVSVTLWLDYCSVLGDTLKNHFKASSKKICRLEEIYTSNLNTLIPPLQRICIQMNFPPSFPPESVKSGGSKRKENVFQKKSPLPPIKGRSFTSYSEIKGKQKWGYTEGMSLQKQNVIETYLIDWVEHNIHGQSQIEKNCDILPMKRIGWNLYRSNEWWQFAIKFFSKWEYD